MTDKNLGTNYKAKEIEAGAIPEARPTKREIIESRRRAKQAIARYQQKKVGNRFREMRAAVYDYWLEVKHQLDTLLNMDLDYQDLRSLEDDRPKTFDNWKQVTEEDEKFWLNLFERLEEAVIDLNIRNIAAYKNQEPHGYEFLNGLDHSMDTGMTGFKRLMKNMRNMRELLRKDVDLVGVVWGGNRTGKSTLCLICCDMVQYGTHKWELPQSHMLFNDNDFKSALKNHDRFSAEFIDEMKLLFHKKDAMNTEQKNRNKMLTTFAKKNMFLMGATNNFYNIDQETINDKVDFAIEIPEQGRFKFYSKAKIKRFEKGSNGEPETPRADFKGRFPDLSSHEDGSKLWERYKEVEDKKLQVGEDDEESPEDKADRLREVAEQVKESPKEYLKELEGRDPIISHRIIKVEHGLSENDAKSVKDVVEAQIDVSKYGDG